MSIIWPKLKYKTFPLLRSFLPFKAYLNLKAKLSKMLYYSYIPIPILWIIVIQDHTAFFSEVKLQLLPLVRYTVPYCQQSILLSTCCTCLTDAPTTHTADVMIHAWIMISGSSLNVYCTVTLPTHRYLRCDTVWLYSCAFFFYSFDHYCTYCKVRIGVVQFHRNW